MNKGDVRYFHLRRVDSNNGGITVAMLKQKLGYHVGVACCSHKDNFCKKTGRMLALNRAETFVPSDTILGFHFFNSSKHDIPDILNIAVGRSHPKYKVRIPEFKFEKAF